MRSPAKIARLKGLDWINSSEKRAMDISMALAAYPVLVPLGSAALGLSRAIDGEGAMFYQTRLGQYGKPIDIKKIRTLHNDTDPHSAGTGPINENATRLGRVLRTLAVDEIPQITNILDGSMTVVGPRTLNYGRLYLMEEVLPKNVYDEWLETYMLSKPGLFSSFGIEVRLNSLTEEQLLWRLAECGIADFKNASPVHDIKLIRSAGRAGFTLALRGAKNLHLAA